VATFTKCDAPPFPDWQAFNRLHDARKPITEIVAVAREEPHALGVLPSHNAEAVVLDLVNPTRADWRLFGCTGEARPYGGETRRNIVRR